jgi:outer membrane biosynthesis protein TonB
MEKKKTKKKKTKKKKTKKKTKKKKKKKKKTKKKKKKKKKTKTKKKKKKKTKKTHCILTTQTLLCIGSYPPPLSAALQEASYHWRQTQNAQRKKSLHSVQQQRRLNLHLSLPEGNNHSFSPTDHH